MVDFGDKARKELIAKLRQQYSEEHNAVLKKIAEKHLQDINRMGEVVASRDNDIALLKSEVEQLNEVAKLRGNLYALSDTFNIAAKRIAETEDPVKEAAELKILADQLLTVVGLPTRPEGTF